MNNRAKKIIIFGIVILVLIILSILLIVKISKNNIKDNERFANEYTEVGKNNVFIYKNADEIIKILENGTGLIYFGFPDGPWCQAYVPILNEVAKEQNAKEIYYLNIQKIRNKNTSDYQRIVKIIKSYLSKDDEGNKRIFVPDVYAIRDGKIIGHNNETSIIIGDIDPNQYWTDDKKTELKNNLRVLIGETYK